MWRGDWICETGGITYISIGAGSIVHLLRVRTALPEDPSVVPIPMPGDSQPPVTPATEGSSASGFRGQLYSREQRDALTSVHTCS